MPYGSGSRDSDGLNTNAELHLHLVLQETDQMEDQHMTSKNDSSNIVVDVDVVSLCIENDSAISSWLYWTQKFVNFFSESPGAAALSVLGFFSLPLLFWAGASLLSLGRLDPAFATPLAACCFDLDSEFWAVNFILPRADLHWGWCWIVTNHLTKFASFEHSWGSRTYNAQLPDCIDKVQFQAAVQLIKTHETM